MRPARGGHSRPPAEVTVVADDARPPGAEPAVDVDRWGRLAHDALVALGVAGPAELSLTFVDADVVAALNAEHLGVDGPTDVLSFPIDDADAAPGVGGSSGAPRLLGDVVVCPAVAADQAPGHAGDLDDELALLVVHGVLHVLGHDHADPDEARAMRALEADVLARLHRPVHAGTDVPGQVETR